MCNIRPFKMQTEPVGKYQKHVHNSQIKTPEIGRTSAIYMARVVNVKVAFEGRSIRTPQRSW